MSEHTPITHRTFVRGLNSSVDYIDQPRGTVRRISNLLYIRRGALSTCDGSAIVNAFNGVPIAGRGRAMCEFLFAPTGVSPYYMRLLKGLDLFLGPPKNLTAADGGAGGTLPINTTQFYKVTALDGAGGETTVSNEASFAVGAASHKVILTWNTVPNAVKYNIYRGTASGAETLITGSNVPVVQPGAGSATVTFTDDGSASSASVNIAAAPNGCVEDFAGATVTVTTTTPHNLAPGQRVILAGVSNAAFNSPMTVAVIVSPTVFISNFAAAPGATGGGGTVTPGVPPVTDTTQQTALVKMPSSSGGISYNNGSIVALYPADFGSGSIPEPDGDLGGGSGSGGGTGGGTGQQGSTPSGGLPGGVSLIPQMVQFTGRVAIALGNGFPPQLYSDATGASVNPAPSVAIIAISVDANGVVTITTASDHKLTTAQVGANILLAGIADAAYNTDPNGSHAFVVLTIPDNTHVTIRNLAAIGHAASAGGTLLVTSVPITSTFQAVYPTWTATTAYLVGDIVAPNPVNGHFYKCIQPGTSNATQPAFPTGTGQQIVDNTGAGSGNVIWQEAGQTNVGAPPPPGAAHMTVYAGALWVFNTSPSNTANGLDGPTSLRMSDVNNPTSWNPVNQAFIDKDDGVEGLGMGAFTITAQGIPPQGSLAVFKLYATYQIVGIFGAPDFAIQRVKTDMGCNAPRTIQFLPGFGIGRMSHLGVAVFDGVEDKLISEDVRPFLFPNNDSSTSDITVADASFLSISWAAQVANPPMYAVAIPIGNSGGSLTRLLCYDLVLKCWGIVDLPFPISTLYQARSTSSNPITLMGSASDGTLQRWQAGDTQWATSAAGSAVPADVAWAVTPPEVYNPRDPTGRFYIYSIFVKGTKNQPSAALNPSINLQGEGAVPTRGQLFLFADNSFELFIPIGEKVTHANLILSGTGDVSIVSFKWDVDLLPSSVPARLT